ncbi:trimeric intracellular cation channel family protein [Olivibacter sitiensis]|uniref:trimeric intracellular cation channel family protein n=1 Tax=Olivibacter sitiensis TaxID=376470 RepID=UPI000411412E|nr:trimeric intracellular cation channel family protein [Olivibacter sitiensis]
MEFLYYFDLLGTFVFAISGALAARDKNIDLFGGGFTGFVTAIGGGSIRDIFLNTRPIWVDDSNYLTSILMGVFIAAAFGKKIAKLRRTLFLFDTIGISFFTIVGLQKALVYDSSQLAAIFLGMFSAVMGGVIRDTLMNETPLIFRKEIYATACLAGALLFIFLYNYGIDSSWSAFLGAALIFTIRIVSVRYKLSLPIIGG